LLHLVDLLQVHGLFLGDLVLEGLLLLSVLGFQAEHGGGLGEHLLWSLLGLLGLEHLLVGFFGGLLESELHGLELLGLGELLLLGGWGKSLWLWSLSHCWLLSFRFRRVSL